MRIRYGRQKTIWVIATPGESFHYLPPEQAQQLEDAKKCFKMSDNVSLGYTDRIEHHIDTGNNKPIKQRPYYSSVYVQQDINTEIDRILKLGIIEPAKIPGWLNPIIAVRKSNGGVRLCLDARKLNACTTKNAYPQQNLNRILERVKGCKYTTTIDLKDAYYQIKISKESRPCTAFSVNSKGTFQYARMAMGLCNASSTLCELIQDIIGCDLEPYVFPYMDDFLVLTPTFEKHMSILKDLASRLATASLTISPDKSKFCMRETTYVGYIISAEGIKANPSRMQPILQYPAPKNLKALRRFIGMSGWYRRFIRDYSTTISPITNLLKKKNLPFKWTPEADEAFQNIKQALVEPPILAPPEFSEPFTIQCDASDRCGTNPDNRQRRKSNCVLFGEIESSTDELLSNRKRMLSSDSGRRTISTVHRRSPLYSSNRPCVVTVAPNNARTDQPFSSVVTQITGIRFQFNTPERKT